MNIEIPDPIRAKLLNERLEPRETKSSAERLDPNLVKLLKETDEPKASEFNTEKPGS